MGIRNKQLLNSLGRRILLPMLVSLSHWNGILIMREKEIAMLS